MNWLTDDLIRDFLESSLNRTEFNEVRHAGPHRAWAVRDLETKRHLGTITYNGIFYDAYSPSSLRGTRVRSFDTALQLIELPSKTEWKEGARPVGEGS